MPERIAADGFNHFTSGTGSRRHGAIDSENCMMSYMTVYRCSKAAADRARMERATLDYAARHRNRSAGWQYRVSVQERKGNTRMKTSKFCISLYNIKKRKSASTGRFLYFRRKNYGRVAGKNHCTILQIIS